MPKRRCFADLVANLFAVVFLGSSGFAQTFSVAIDSDNDPATGCDFTVNQGAGPQVLTEFEQGTR